MMYVCYEMMVFDMCFIFIKKKTGYVGCSGSSWNLVIKCSNIYIILSFFEISQVDINELASRS